MSYRFRRKPGVKYNNTKVTCDGHTFDSKHEYNRYCELKLLEKGNVISNLELQKKFVLIPAQYAIEERYGKNGKRLKDGKILLEREVAYFADFCYTLNKTGETIVEDAKSQITREDKTYILKRKMLLYFHGIRVVEI